MNLRRSVALLALASVSGSALAVACSSFDEDPVVPTDDGGVEGASTADGGTIDATDERSDAASDGPGLSFCAEHDAALACADFATGATGSYGFQKLEQQIATVELDSKLFTSPPSAARIKTQTLDDAAPAYGLFVYDRPTTPKTLSVTGSFYVNQIDSSSDDGMSLISVGAGGTFAVLKIAKNKRCSLEVAGLLPDGGPGYQVEDCGAVPFQTWTRIKVVITFPDRAAVSIDGASKISKTIPSVAGPDAGGDAGTVSGARIGLRSFGPATEQEVLVDDVLVE